MVARVAAERVEAVDRDAAAHHVEVGRGVAERGGAVRRVDRDPGVALLRGLGDRAEALELLAHERRVLVSRREVGPHARELHPLVGGDRVDQRGDLARIAQAEPPHARVVLHVDARGNTQLCRDRAQELARGVTPDRDLGPGSERLGRSPRPRPSP